MGKPKATKLNTYRTRAILWLSFGALIVITAGTYFLWPKHQPAEISTEQTTLSSVIPAQTEIQTAPPPISKDLSVPYAPQAPFSNWTVHEESCEEAAIYMYHGFLENISYPNNRIPEAEADTAFRAMKQWQVTNYGSEPDLTMTALGNFAQSYYGYTPVVTKNVTAEDIKQVIFDGHPVVVPVMTLSLQNNMYGPVSVYHALLIKGYDANGVITNDAGVGNGPDHHYDWAVLWQAIDAQTAKMNQGRELLYLTK